MRDGRVVDIRATREAKPAALIEAIVGRRPENLFVRAPAVATKPVLVCENLACENVGPLTFTVGAGEIVALIGLRGAGQEAVGRALVGAGSMLGGTVTIHGRALDCTAPASVIRGGLGFVAGDRVAESVAPTLSVRENMFVNPAACGRGHFHWRKPAGERSEARKFGRAVGLSPNDPEAPIETLSGGNQQKVVLARWMRIAPKVLVLEDPTAGVDIGAKAEIYRLLGQSLVGGQAILLVSTDFEEVAAICHRALIFRNGQIVAELAGDGLSTQALTRAATMSEPPETVH
jgi:ribose transport system ATP-binding protein